MRSRLRELVYGAGMAGGALALAWAINWVFERSWEAITLILLAMMIATLLQRMVSGGIPEGRERPARTGATNDEARPSIREETAHLAGADRRYGWMALPPALAFIAILISAFL